MNSAPPSTPPSLRPPPLCLSAPIPQALWFKGLQTEPVVYQGTPVEMVCTMAKEMGPCITPHDCIDFLCRHLARTRRLYIRVPDAPIEIRANIFIRSLLATNVALPLASA